MKKVWSVALFIVAVATLSTDLLAADQDKQTPQKANHAFTVSADGKFLIDATGNQVGQYLRSEKVFVPLKVKDKNGVEFDPSAQNKLTESSCRACNCHRECIRWDERGFCNGWAQHCDICCE